MSSPETPYQVLYTYRVLYVGNDLALLTFLRHALEQQKCSVVRCADATTARVFVKSENRYALLLLDAELPDATGEELAAFTRGLPHREHTPLVVRQSEDFDSLAKAVRRQLCARRNR
jgi:CheY-like chemotaxis protein